MTHSTKVHPPRPLAAACGSVPPGRRLRSPPRLPLGQMLCPLLRQMLCPLLRQMLCPPLVADVVSTAGADAWRCGSAAEIIAPPIASIRGCLGRAQGAWPALGFVAIIVMPCPIFAVRSPNFLTKLTPRARFYRFWSAFCLKWRGIHPKIALGGRQEGRN